jgi:hypothetical protein
MLGRVPWPLAGALAGVLYLAVLHVARVDGPGGLRVLGRGFGTRDIDPPQLAGAIAAGTDASASVAHERNDDALPSPSARRWNRWRRRDRG